MQALDSEGRELAHPGWEGMPEVWCRNCGSHTHGHGWRRRYVKYMGEDKTIWVGRRRCPSCGSTYTILPQDVSPLCIWDTASNVAALLEWVVLDRLPVNSESGMSAALRRHKRDNYLKRARLEGFAGMEVEEEVTMLGRIAPWAGTSMRLRVLEMPGKGLVRGIVRGVPTILCGSRLRAGQSYPP